MGALFICSLSHHVVCALSLGVRSKHIHSVYPNRVIPVPPGFSSLHLSVSPSTLCLFTFLHITQFTSLIFKSYLAEIPEYFPIYLSVFASISPSFSLSLLSAPPLIVLPLFLASSIQVCSPCRMTSGTMA